MPMDRRVIIQLMAEGYRDPDLQGEYVPGDITAFPRWATEQSAGSVDTNTIGGVRVDRSINFTVRWFKALADTPINFVSVVGSDGQTYNADNVTMSDERNRFIIIEGVLSA